MKRLIKADNSRIGQYYILLYQYVTSNYGWNLVHGYITDKISTGRMIDHAWCKQGDIVYDPVLDWTIPKQVYYGIFDAKVDKTYTRDETLNAALNSGTYGPWCDLKPINWWPT